MRGHAHTPQEAKEDPWVVLKRTMLEASSRQSHI